MKKRFLSYLQYALFLGAGIFLIWWQLHDMTPEQEAQFLNALRSANYVLIIPVVFMNLLSHLSRSMRWKLLMEPLGYNPKLKNVFAVTMVGYLANSAIPRLGEVLKCTFLARYEKLKADKLIGTILIERTFDLICYFIFILITVLIQIDKIGGYVSAKLQLLMHGGSVPLWGKLLILVAGILIIVFTAKKIFKTYPDNKALIKIKNFFSGIGKGFIAIKDLKKRKAFLAHTLFIWTMYLLQIYIAFSAIQGTAHLGIKAAFSVLSLSTLAMILTPGGIGSFPIFVMQTLTVYGLTTVHEKATSEALGWLIWGVSTGIIIIAGLISLLLLPYINKHKHEGDLGSTAKDHDPGNIAPADPGVEA